jgi:predicted acylesterase/phospholipase RssA
MRNADWLSRVVQEPHTARRLLRAAQRGTPSHHRPASGARYRCPDRADGGWRIVTDPFYRSHEQATLAGALAGKTIDGGSILTGIVLPGSIADKVVDAYGKHLFGNATLQALPAEPRFVINATSVQIGALWRFSRPYMADYRVGMVRSPTVELAKAVAASAAFPPVLSPLRLELDASRYDPPSAQASEDLHREPFLTDVVLSDGGVYDNLGLETA